MRCVAAQCLILAAVHRLRPQLGHADRRIAPGRAQRAADAVGSGWRRVEHGDGVDAPIFQLEAGVDRIDAIERERLAGHRGAERCGLACQPRGAGLVAVGAGAVEALRIPGAQPLHRFARHYLPHRQRPLGGGTVPAPVQPRVHVRPLAEIERQRTHHRRRHVQIRDAELAAGEPLRLAQRDLQHVERRHDLVPRSLGGGGIALRLRQHEGVVGVGGQLPVEPVRLPEAPLPGARLVLRVGRVELAVLLREIQVDRHRFRQHEPVIVDGRHPGVGVQRQILRRLRGGRAGRIVEVLVFQPEFPGHPERADPA